MNRRRNMAISNNVLVNNKTLRGFLLIGQVPVTSEVTAYIEICDIEVTEFWWDCCTARRTENSHCVSAGIRELEAPSGASERPFPLGPSERPLHRSPLPRNLTVVFGRAFLNTTVSPVFNIQERITVPFHTQCALCTVCTRIAVGKTCWNEKFKYQISNNAIGRFHYARITSQIFWKH